MWLFPKLTCRVWEQLIRGEPFRGKFRHGFEKPEPFAPGKVEEIDFTMPDINHTFRRGHRIMVQVQSSLVPPGGPEPAELLWTFRTRGLRTSAGPPSGSTTRADTPQELSWRHSSSRPPKQGGHPVFFPLGASQCSPPRPPLHIREIHSCPASAPAMYRVEIV